MTLASLGGAAPLTPAPNPLSDDFSPAPARPYALYDALASRYDRMHGRWLQHAGGAAQAALEASLFARITPGMQILDAGCGTGALARRIQRQFGDAVDLTLLDESAAMLARTEDIVAKRAEASLLDMPFEARQFDLAVAAWSIEATQDEAAAVAELCRVVRPGGHILIAFCATEPVDHLFAALLRKTVQLRGTGRFLDVTAVEAALRQAGGQSVLRHRCAGPAAVLDATRGWTWQRRPDALRARSNWQI